MKKYLLPNEGRFYKANLHCHTNISDGELTPVEVKKLYKNHGYSVIAYTDHEVFIPHNELTDEDFIALSGVEVQFNGSNKYPGNSVEKKCHLCLIAGSPDTVKQPCYGEKYAYIGNGKNECKNVIPDEESSPYERVYSPEGISELMHVARDKGFFITYNHPTWSLEDYEQYTKYEGMHAVEIYNRGTELLGYQGYVPNIYDDILRTGKEVFASAGDDNHEGREPYCFGGFVMIKADELKYETVMESLFAGNYYSSMGPEIYELYIEDDEIHISCSDAAMIALTTDRRVSASVRSDGGEPVREAVFKLNRACKYFRITLRDEKGKYANTNAYFIKNI